MKPNLFLIGAPKCGTTALANYLNQHPDVGMCKYKEPFFFADEFKELHKAGDIEAYKKLYNEKALSKKIVFEGSTHYLMSYTAIDNILSFNPEAKFICMLRNPFELIPSWHDELVYQGHQKSNLVEAIEKAEKMNQKRSEKVYTNSEMMYDYIHVASNGKHTERLLDKVDREKIKFIKFDDFTIDTEAVFDEVCEFLNIPKTQIEFKKVNARKYHKSPTMVSLIRKTAKVFKSMGVKNSGVGNRLISLQLDKKKRKNNVAYPDNIISILNEDINVLQGQLSTNLTKWTKKN